MADFDLSVDVLILGAGGGGLTAALAAHEVGAEVLVLEADPIPSGSTALSAGLIPAAGTVQQAAAGIADTPQAFAADIMAKANCEPDQTLVNALAGTAAPTIAWLGEVLAEPLTVVDDFDYPGHSARRMHGLPSRTGQSLVNALRAACESRDIPIICERRGAEVIADGAICGLCAELPDGGVERIGCRALVLACGGFGGAPDLVARHTPSAANGTYFGHPTNRGEALAFADALNLKTAALSAYQGHGNVAHPHGILITWATITEGGIQVNTNGKRFWNEAQGYSEAAAAVLAQAGGVAFTIFDEPIAAIARQFEDFRNAEASGAIKTAAAVDELAAQLDLPPDALNAALAVTPDGPDQFGRTIKRRLKPPYCGVKVTGALFHTQGGLSVDTAGQAIRADGTPMPGLYAVGGAAVGVSGNGDSGYLSGNGLLSAIVLGKLAGAAAAKSTN
ncbi:MAG: FAD-binding protein [Pseudomonadota bacterium]